jgi:hypothetical protein
VPTIHFIQCNILNNGETKTGENEGKWKKILPTVSTILEFVGETEKNHNTSQSKQHALSCESATEHYRT